MLITILENTGNIRKITQIELDKYLVNYGNLDDNYIMADIIDFYYFYDYHLGERGVDLRIEIQNFIESKLGFLTLRLPQAIVTLEKEREAL